MPEDREDDDFGESDEIGRGDENIVDESDEDEFEEDETEDDESGQLGRRRGSPER